MMVRHTPQSFNLTQPLVELVPPGTVLVHHPSLGFWRTGGKPTSLMILAKAPRHNAFRLSSMREGCPP